MQQVWRKRWRNTGWIALAAITLVLIISAISKKNHKVCNGIEVSFARDGSNFFVDEKGVVAVLKEYGPIKGEPIKSIDLNALEGRLKSDKWIANAELFFDNKQVLQVILEEKEPVARIFTIEGSSFYIDSACRKLPLSEKLSARIPMFTSFPSARDRLSKPDSQLLAYVKELAMFIQADEFWKAQVAQVDITPEGFEMIPTVGNHIVELGKEGNWQRKFDRLFSFYKQVWTKVGFERYEKVDVQFEGQVVATVKGAKPARVDSAKARMAYESLVAEVKSLTADSMPPLLIKPVGRRDTARATTSAKPGVASRNINSEKKKILLGKRNIVAASLKKEPAKQPSAKVASKPTVVKQLAAKKQASDKKVAKAVLKKPLSL
ncbi:MAG: hypothetical protein JWQ40_1824 [Segetibacter sp.]|nr:hypothetical protein [Segetibacter sp.]